ncbi:MAG: hypothetical protein KGJ55_03635 [Gammaproteobacteria bacterium]|nr:hypothetical protein [Gammaproteobacteria bacterium]
MEQTLNGFASHGIAAWLSTALAILLLLLLWSAVATTGHLRRRRPLRAVTGLLRTAALAAIVALAASVGLNLLTYARLTAEHPVAGLRFARLAPQIYDVVLTESGRPPQHATLAGDDWQLDARVVKWKGWVTLLGLPPLYRLERLSGRYEDLHQAQTTPPSIVGLAADPGLPLAELGRLAPWLSLVDARYGSSAYLPMADGAEYTVTLGNAGLIARPANAAAEKTVAGWR